MDASSTGSHGQTPLGDLATVICSYDHTAGYSSNSLASYFHDLGWRQRLHDLVNGPWLSSPSADEESLGGNYGEATPGDLSFDLLSGDGEQWCEADRDPWEEVFPNSLTTLSAAEMTRRLVLHDEVS